MYDSITDVFQKIRKARDRALFVLVCDPISSDTFDKIYAWRKQLCEMGKGLDVLIDTPGGALEACYTVARLLSRCSDSWEALVPEIAASGGTLICLGSSNIVMAVRAQLSPLDPQVISKRREKFFGTERQSPLEAFQAVRYLREYTLASLDVAMKFLREPNRDVAPHRALETSTQVALGLVQPVLAKIEPYDLGAFALDSSLALNYCKRVGNPTNTAKKTQRRVDYRTLVEMYPAHEFFIDIDEARELNFAAAEPNEELDKLFDEVRPLLEKVQTYAGLVPTV